MGKCIPLSTKFFHRVLRMLCTFDFLHNLWKFWVKFCCGCRRESPWIARAFAVRFAANTFVETQMNLQQNKFCFLENNTFFAFEKSTNSFSHESSQHALKATWQKMGFLNRNSLNRVEVRIHSNFFCNFWLLFNTYFPIKRRWNCVVATYIYLYIM